MQRLEKAAIPGGCPASANCKPVTTTVGCNPLCSSEPAGDKPPGMLLGIPGAQPEESTLYSLIEIETAYPYDIKRKMLRLGKGKRKGKEERREGKRRGEEEEGENRRKEAG